MSIVEKIAAMNAAVQELKVEFSEFIKNKEVPLDARWQTWLDAPSEFKNKRNYIHHFKTLPNDYIMYDGHFHAERHETVKMSDVVERLEEELPERTDWNENLHDELEKFGFDMNKLKEEILEINLESFEYDW